MSSEHPLLEIGRERERARAAGDPLADVCFLATADAHGQPSLRAISLRHVEPCEGIGILINARSPKGAQLEANPRCELLILWKGIARQYRLRGELKPMSDERLAAYWARKAPSSQLLEHYYEAHAEQSSPIPDGREGFLERIDELRERFRGGAPLPEGLRALNLVPAEVDVWHGHPERLHERWRCVRTGERWERTLLVP